MSSTVSAEARIGKKGEGVFPDNGAQSVTATITYLRRAGLTALVFITPEGEDDDGNRSQGIESGPPPSEHERMAQAFRARGVGITALEKRLGHPIAKTTAEEFDDLRAVYEQIKAGANVDEFFPTGAAAKDEPQSRSEPVEPDTNPEPKVPPTVEAPAVDHTPAAPGNEPRPGERKPRGRGRPPKAQTLPTPSTGRPETGQEPPPSDVPVEDPPVFEESQTDDGNRPATAEEKRPLYARLKEIGEATGKDKLREFIIRESGASDTSSLSKRQWDAIMNTLEAAATAGTLKDLMEGGKQRG